MNVTSGKVAAGPDMVRGSLTGVDFPTSIAALLAGGPTFLTRAFRAAGALGNDNEVAAVTGSEEFFGGGMGRKLWLDVEYARPDPALKERLFVKFPRDFGDPLRSLFAPLMEPEVRFALLSRRDDFPIRVPECYFGDYDPETLSGLLITERVPYGQGNVEPAHDKCLDYEIADPLPHYQALTRTMAKLAAAHKGGRIGATIDTQFPFDPDATDNGSRVPYTPEQLDEKLAKLKSFATAAPQLFPDELGDPAFLDRFAREAALVLAHQDAIRRHLNRQSELIALCHWNMNIDNAWFWRGSDGTLETGLLDWGSVAQMNLAQAFYGMFCAAEADFLDAHEEELIDLLLAEYRGHGGPAIDRDAFVLSLRLSIALLGVAWMLDAPSLVEAQVPNVATVADRHDPRLKGDFLARAQLQLLVVFLNEWRREDIGAILRRFGTSGA